MSQNEAYNNEKINIRHLVTEQIYNTNRCIVLVQKMDPNSYYSIFSSGYKTMKDGTVEWHFNSSVYNIILSPRKVYPEYLNK